MKKNVLIFSFLGLGLLFSQCDPAKRVVANDSDQVFESDKMQLLVPEEPPIMQDAQSFNSMPMGGSLPTKGNVPIDRVKLKGSPRGILTWRADYAWDTASTLEGLGSFEVKKEGSTLKVNHIFNGMSTAIFTANIGPGSIAQLGLYKHNLNNEDHVIVFYSEDDNQIKSVVVKAANNQNIPFMAPATNLANPIPYYELAPNKLNIYPDEVASLPTKSYSCINNQMIQN